MAVDVDLADALAVLERLGGRFAALVEGIAAPDAATHGLEWTLAETAVHVLQAFREYLSSARGDVTPSPEPIDNIPAYVARVNREQIDAEPERGPAALAGMLRDAITALVDWARAAGPEHVVTFAAGYSFDTTTTACSLIAELVVHGYDIARTTGDRWDVDRHSATLAVYATSAALDLALDRRAAAGEHVHVDLRPRGGRPFSIRIEHGRAWTEAAGGRPDVHLSVDPLAYLLVGFGRVGLVGPSLTGKLILWGRRPWVMLRMPKMFLNP